MIDDSDLDPGERGLAVALRAAAGSAIPPAAVSGAPALDVWRTGRRRQRLRQVVGTMAAVVALVGGLVLWPGWPVTRPQPPATPAPTTLQLPDRIVQIVNGARKATHEDPVGPVSVAYQTVWDGDGWFSSPTDAVVGVSGATGEPRVCRVLDRGRESDARDEPMGDRCRDL